MAITATFSVDTGVLTEIGDNLDNAIVTSRNAAGNILINGGAVAVQGGTPTVANTARIDVFGQDGNDTITLDQANGALPAAHLFGGIGNDVMTGGAGNDELRGEDGNDILLGKGGFDLLFGGEGNDTLTGGDADDQMFGEGGDDRMIWDIGDDTDLAEGGEGNDTAEVNGGNGDEVFTITANGTRVRFDRLNPAPFSIDIGTTENIVINANGGNDSFSATGNLATLIKITFDGGAGNDTILGGNGADRLLGGDGDDFIDGQQGSDTIFLGAGNDVFQWDPGDGSDTIEGQDGTDTMLFNASAGNEIFEASANGERGRFTRNLGNIVMDLNDMEGIDLNALGGTDTITVNDLSGTDLTQLNVNLAGTLGGTAGDAQADVVIVNGSNTGDVVNVSGAGTSVSVVGLAALVNITAAEGANDALVINALGGNDTINATTLPAGVIKLTIDGGAGDDRLNGSQGADVFLGGDGNDIVFGDNGNDLALLGAGDDVFFWAPGDGNDTVEGQDGFDALGFTGSGASENIDILANGGRVLFLRDVASVTMDLDDVERIKFSALGGADNIVVGDLSGTDVTAVQVNLQGPNGPAEGQPDTVTVSATQGDDAFTIFDTGNAVFVTGLAAVTMIENPEGALDRLTVNAQGGDDVINAGGLEAGKISLTMNGGLGDDIFIGSEGNDSVNGGDGNDTALLGAGDDVFTWNPGDDNDTIEGQEGVDTLLFNGANVAERIDIAAIGGRARFFRDIANVTMDLNDVETIRFTALGGADTIVVNDLSGTDLKVIAIDLAATLGGATGDAQPDSVSVQASSGDDEIGITANGTVVTVNGLAAQVSIDHAEAANDRLTVNGLAGNDFMSAFLLPANLIQLTMDGGAGDDELFDGVGNGLLSGGAGDDFLKGFGGNDVLAGGDGDDALEGGDGDDVIDGGAGNDILSFEHAALGVNVSLSGSLQVPGLGNDNITGIEGLRGSGGNDTLGGNAFDNVLDGFLGTDRLEGKAGDDQYFVDTPDDVVIELVDGGEDRVLASVSYTLGAGQAIEKLTTTNSDGKDAINLTGNAFANAIVGNAGANVLDGKGGADALFGLGGDDTYFVGNAGDTVEEAAGGGNDRVLASVSYTLGAGQEIEKLTTIDNGGLTAINLTGNGFANAIFGNAGANTLDGKAGADTLVGFGGNDFFFVDNANDVVVEAVGGGSDRVLASVSYTLGAGQEIERLTTGDIAGTAAINLTGNGFANAIFGNAGANILNGKGGADTLVGLGGDDFYFVDNAGDTVSEAVGGGNDRVFASIDYTLGGGVQVETLSTDSTSGVASITLVGNALNNTLMGNAGSNALKGGLGNDLLFGGGGSDAFAFNTALNAANNVDTILDFNVAADDMVLSSAIFTAAAPGVLSAGAFFVGTAAHDADDRIVYDSATGALSYDADGIGGTAAIQFASVSAGLGLTHNDFIVA